MTAASSQLVLRRAARIAVRPRLGAVGLVVALAAIVGARWAGTRLGLDALALGAAFGVALLWAARAGGWRPPSRVGTASLRPANVRLLAVGGVVGLGLAVVTTVAPSLAGVVAVPGLGRPAAPFVPWALVILLVAGAEETLLRGALFDRLLRWGGAPVAIAVTTVAFALMHVPLYGWHVLPLDLAVGLVFGGLRLATRGVAAPAAAHAVADLATWWL
jgi:membrane protease YdiL (CAAX protease family)